MSKRIGVFIPIERELNFQCLNCGKYLGVRWTDPKPEGKGYHMHICLKCRDKLIEEMR